MDDKERRMKRLEQFLQPERKHPARRMREIEESMTPEERRAYNGELSDMVLAMSLEQITSTPFEEIERQYPTFAKVYRSAHEDS